MGTESRCRAIGRLEQNTASPYFLCSCSDTIARRPARLDMDLQSHYDHFLRPGCGLVHLFNITKNMIKQAVGLLQNLSVFHVSLVCDFTEADQMGVSPNSAIA